MIPSGPGPEGDPPRAGAHPARGPDHGHHRAEGREAEADRDRGGRPARDAPPAEVSRIK